MKAVIDIGAEVDFVTQGELDESLKRAHQTFMSAQVQGRKYMRFRMRATVASTAITLGGDGDQPGPGPDQGYAWAIRRLFVKGLTAGSTPDELWFYRNNASSDPVWQISGADPGDKFGRLEIVLLGGEKLAAANNGALAATGQITVNGEAVEVPQEMLGVLS